jgi:hypothetical protein
MSDFVERWNALSVRDKRILMKLILEEKTGLDAALEEHMSSSRLDQLWQRIRKTLGCQKKVRVAFEMGKNWSTLEGEKRCSQQ